MILKPWDELPELMRTEAVKPYYEKLKKHQVSLILKRLFDICGSIVLIVLLSPLMLVITFAIKRDSYGPVLFLQERVTTYGKHFRIWKFRTMVSNAEKIGSQVTLNNDKRVTKIGSILRNYRLDELPQLVNILAGDMSFVGTRPEVVKYVERYEPEMMATLLLPAGVTSEASIRYKDESILLESAEDVDEVYVKKILPEKMVWNLESIERFSFARDLLTMIRTVFAVLGKEYY